MTGWSGTWLYTEESYAFQRNNCSCFGLEKNSDVVSQQLKTEKI